MPLHRLYTFTPATISLPHAMDRALAKLKGGRDTFIVKPDASSQVSAQCSSATPYAGQAEGRAPHLHRET